MMEAWQATVQDEAGNVIFNPLVTVYKTDGATLANIFNEDGSPKENPFTGTIEGFAQFWAGPGTYKIQAQNGGSSQVWSVKKSPIVTPMDFGAWGDGVGDDTQYIREAIRSGQTINWASGVYRITQPIDEEIAHKIDWQSSGARIICDFSETSPAMIRLVVHPADHKIVGDLTFECDRKVRRGLYIRSPEQNLGQFPVRYPNITIDGLSVYDPHLNVTNDSCEGLLVEGGFANVILNNVKVYNSTRAVGAGLQGSYGCFGISVLRIGSDTAATPVNVVINSPFIDTVISEDPTQYWDQDGIRVLLNFNFRLPHGTDAVYTIKDGYFRNCRNRSIKGQANMGTISDCTFVRTGNLGATSLKGVTPDVDEQIGNLVLTGSRHHYDTYIPGALSSLGRTWLSGYPRIGSFVRDTRVEVLNYSGGQFDLYTSTIDSGAESDQEATIDGVSVVGAVVRRLLTIFVSGGTVNPKNVFRVQNVTCDLSGGAVIYNGGNGGGRADISVQNLWNTGSGVPGLIFGGTGENIKLSFSGCKNIGGAALGNPASGQYPQSEAVKSIIAEDRVGPRYGRTVFLSYDLNDGEEATLPIGSFASSAGIIIVGVGHGAASAQAIIACGNSGPVLLTPASTNWNVGGTSDPGSGMYRCYNDGQRTVIRNMSGVARCFTIQMIG